MPVPVIGPPVRPAPVATLVTVPLPVPGKVWPRRNSPAPCSHGRTPFPRAPVPFDPNSRFKEPEGDDVVVPRRLCLPSEKSCVTAAALLLLYEDACKSMGSR